MNKIPTLLADLLKTSSSLIFLGGVHGVGKTTVCEQVFTPVGYRCVTASCLIKEYGVRSDQDKRVKNVSDNQRALLEQLYFKKRLYAHLLLDGHYCLINNNNEIEQVDVEVFRQINPDIFILLKDCPEKILERLKNRDGKKWDKVFVEKFQKAEEQNAQTIADKLGIALYIIFNGEVVL